MLLINWLIVNISSSISTTDGLWKAAAVYSAILHIFVYDQLVSSNMYWNTVVDTKRQTVYAKNKLQMWCVHARQRVVSVMDVCTRSYAYAILLDRVSISNRIIIR